MCIRDRIHVSGNVHSYFNSFLIKPLFTPRVKRRSNSLCFIFFIFVNTVVWCKFIIDYTLVCFTDFLQFSIFILKTKQSVTFNCFLSWIGYLNFKLTTTTVIRYKLNIFNHSSGWVGLTNLFHIFSTQNYFWCDDDYFPCVGRDLS